MIHHASITALCHNEADPEAGAFDVIEDGDMIQVVNRPGGIALRFESVKAATDAAYEMADAYDRKHWQPAWQAAVKGGELRGFWEWMNEERPFESR